MVKVIAVTVIHRTIENGVRGDKSKGIAPVKPKVQVIKPGTIFNANESEFAELMSAGAIRVPEPGEKVYVAVNPADVNVDEGDAGEAPAEKKAAGKSTSRVKPTKKAEPTQTENDLV